MAAPRMLNQSELKARKLELEALLAQAMAKLKPIQDERDKLVAQYDPKLRELNAKVKKLRDELKLYELQMELGAVTRAMKRS